MADRWTEEDRGTWVIHLASRPWRLGQIVDIDDEALTVKFATGPEPLPRSRPRVQRAGDEDFDFRALTEPDTVLGALESRERATLLGLIESVTAGRPDRQFSVRDLTARAELLGLIAEGDEPDWLSVEDLEQSVGASRCAPDGEQLRLRSGTERTDEQLREALTAFAEAKNRDARERAATEISQLATTAGASVPLVAAAGALGIPVPTGRTLSDLDTSALAVLPPSVVARLMDATGAEDLSLLVRLVCAAPNSKVAEHGAKLAAKADNQDLAIAIARELQLWTRELRDAPDKSGMSHLKRLVKRLRLVWPSAPAPSVFEQLLACALAVSEIAPSDERVRAELLQPLGGDPGIRNALGDAIASISTSSLAAILAGLPLDEDSPRTQLLAAAVRKNHEFALSEHAWTGVGIETVIRLADDQDLGPFLVATSRGQVLLGDLVSREVDRLDRRRLGRLLEGPTVLLTLTTRETLARQLKISADRDEAIAALVEAAALIEGARQKESAAADTATARLEAQQEVARMQVKLDQAEQALAEQVQMRAEADRRLSDHIGSQRTATDRERQQTTFDSMRVVAEAMCDLYRRATSSRDVAAALDEVIVRMATIGLIVIDAPGAHVGYDPLRHVILVGEAQPGDLVAVIEPTIGYDDGVGVPPLVYGIVSHIDA